MTIHNFNMFDKVNISVIKLEKPLVHNYMDKRFLKPKHKRENVEKYRSTCYNVDI